MNETFTYTAGHDPIIGWVSLVLCAVIALIGRKQRAFLGPALGGIAAIVYLVLRLEDKYVSLIAVLLFIGMLIDSVRSEQFRKMSRLGRFGTVAAFAPIIALGVLMAIVDEPSRVVITDDQLIEQYGRDAFFRQWGSTSLGRDGMSATVIRFTDGGLKEYRFRSTSNSDVMLPIEGYGFYRDESGRLWTPDELCQHITKWAGASLTVKTEERPPTVSFGGA